MSTLVWTGTRKLDDLWGKAESDRRGRKERRRKQIVGRCAICGRDIHWGESYHVDGHRSVHLRCEWKGK